jgi:tRNA(Leu) C34 or U34 (ribose-2'-O)-methylase TrmL
MTRGFSSIGLVRPKTSHNIGAVLRAAGCYGSSTVLIEGVRCKGSLATDTQKQHRHIPLIHVESLRDSVPYKAVPVAVDLVDDAVSLVDFVHPQSAFYIFGPEDGTLGKNHLDWCPYRVMIPTKSCMNLAATVNVVLYDRLAKRGM